MKINKNGVSASNSNGERSWSSWHNKPENIILDKYNENGPENIR